MSHANHSSENFSKSVGDAHAGATHGDASALSHQFIQLMQDGMKNVFKGGGGGGGDPFNFQKMQEELTKGLSENLYGGKK